MTRLAQPGAKAPDQIVRICLLEVSMRLVCRQVSDFIPLQEKRPLFQALRRCGQFTQLHHLSVASLAFVEIADEHWHDRKTFLKSV
jgi:hypothetical protein